MESQMASEYASATMELPLADASLLNFSAFCRQWLDVSSTTLRK